MAVKMVALMVEMTVALMADSLEWRSVRRSAVMRVETMAALMVEMTA